MLYLIKADAIRIGRQIGIMEFTMSDSLFKGDVSVRVNSKGIPEIKKVDADPATTYQAHEVASLYDAIIQQVKKLSFWSVWIDKPEKIAQPECGFFTDKQLASFLVGMTQMKLLAVKRRSQLGNTYRAPVIYIGYSDSRNILAKPAAENAVAKADGDTNLVSKPAQPAQPADTQIG